MYLVTCQNQIRYLGECRDKAIEAFNANQGASLQFLNSGDELNTALRDDKDPSDAFKSLIDRLDGLGVNQELAAKIKDNGVKLFGEAKSLGVRGLKVVGEGFVAIGELLKGAGEDQPCSRPHCCKRREQ